MSLNPEQVSKRRFLVVEDQEFQRWVIGNLLESLGAVKVFSAGDGRAALEIVSGLHPPIDVVVTDLNMPGMDGIEFIRHLGEVAPSVTLVVVSGQQPGLLASVATMARAYGVQLLDAIAKPVTATKLAAALERLGDRPVHPAPVARSHRFSVEQIVEGLKRGQFAPFYQPKVEVKTGVVRGGEAFARWRHPEHGLVLPASFIPQLESASLMETLTFGMLRQAAAACREWARAGFDMTIAVNISRTSLDDTALADRIYEQVMLQGVEPRRIILEVTESAASTHVGRVLDNLARLRMKGFGLSIDDYGTGYSSMRQLTLAPFTELKVDQSFVRKATTHAPSRAVLESSLEIAAKLRLPAVAEGVETRHELNLLMELDCPMAQGYYVARPMSGDDFLEWLMDTRRGGKTG